MTPVGVPRRFVHVGGVKTAYLDVGSGEPIVALHGVPTSSELFEPLIPALDGFRLVAPDLLGQGETAVPPRGRLGFGEYAAHLSAFLETVAPPTFHLVVHDFGGVLGLAWASAHPQRLRSLVVLSTSASYTLRWAIVAAGFWALELLGGAGAVRGQLPRTAKRIGAIDPGLAERWSRPWTRARVLRGADHFSREHLRHAGAWLRRIKAPALVLWGGADDVFPPRYGRKIVKGLPKAEMKIVPGAGHWLPIDAPDTAGAEIAAFIRRAAPPGAAAAEKLAQRFRPPTAS